MSDELRALHAGGDARDKGKPLRGVPSNCYAILEPRWVQLNPAFPCKGRKPLFCLGLSSLGGDDGIRFSRTMRSVFPGSDSPPDCHSLPFPLRILLAIGFSVPIRFCGLLFGVLVEMMGFEPMTPCLQGRCSPSWATPPFEVRGKSE